MDALSQLLSLSQAQVRVDVRCMLAGSFVIPHEASQPGEASFHLLLAGECRLQVGRDQLLPLKAGDFVLLPHGSAHDMTDAHKRSRPARTSLLTQTTDAALPIKHNLAPSRVTEVDLLCGRFVYPPGAGTLLMRALPEVLHVCMQDAQGMEPLRVLIALLRNEVTQPQSGSLAIVNALGQALLTLALRAYGRGDSSTANLLALATDIRLGASIQAALNAPGEPWTIASLGETVAMSRATYARQFQLRTGLSVGAFLVQVRMMHACTLLTKTSRGLADIAEAVGYRSEAAFGKAFRQIVGKTPGLWRRELGSRSELGYE